jgi:hypothetical protein
MHSTFAHISHLPEIMAVTDTTWDRSQFFLSQNYCQHTPSTLYGFTSCTLTRLLSSQTLQNAVYCSLQVLKNRHIHWPLKVRKPISSYIAHGEISWAVLVCWKNNFNHIALRSWQLALLLQIEGSKHTKTKLTNDYENQNPNFLSSNKPQQPKYRSQAPACTLAEDNQDSSEFYCTKYNQRRSSLRPASKGTWWCDNLLESTIMH